MNTILSAILHLYKF